MSEKVVSIEIDQHRVKALELSESGKNRVTISGIVEFDTPHEIYVDGYITDTAKIGEMLRLELSNAGIKTKNAIFTIVSNKVMSREASFVYLKERDIHEAVEGAAGDYFPMDLADHVVSYSVTYSDKKENKTEVTIFAAPEKLIQDYFNIAESAGLSIVSVDYCGNSAANWMKRNFEKKRVVLLQVNRFNTIATIMNEGRMSMQRSMSYGTADLIDGVRTHSGIEDDDAAFSRLVYGKLLNSTLGAEPVKADQAAPGDGDLDGLDLSFGTEGDDPEPAAEGGSAAVSLEKTVDVDKNQITESAAQLVSNVVRFIEYHNTKNRNVKIDSIYLAGEGVQVQGLAELIGNETSLETVPVSSLINLSNIKGANKLSSRDVSYYLDNFGAIIDPLGFISQEYANRQMAFDSQQKLVYFALLVGLISLLIVVLFTGQYMYARAQNASLQKRVDELAYIHVIHNEYLSAVARNAEVTAIDKSTDELNELLNELYESLERNLPSYSVISSMSSVNDMVSLSLTTYSKEAAAKLIEQVKDISCVDESTVSVATLTDEIDEQTGQRHVEFTLSFYLTDENIASHRGEEENEEPPAYTQYNAASHQVLEELPPTSSGGGQ